jgi:hypothetical protein
MAGCDLHGFVNFRVPLSPFYDDGYTQITVTEERRKLLVLQPEQQTVFIKYESRDHQDTCHESDKSQIKIKSS